MTAVETLWPLFGLRLRCAGVELRLPDDDDLAALADLARQPVHDPATMPFSVPWTDAPPEERAAATLRWHWRCRGEWRPESWRLELVAVRGGEVVGTQGLHGADFGVTGEVVSGSWVGGRFQGKGVATAMRTAMLGLAFDGLGARAARSAAFVDNPASLRVSEKLGYRHDGTETLARRGQAAEQVRLVLTRGEWEAGAGGRATVEIEGVEACRSLFGLEAAASP
jgi:RimJ/RimL family protein N-acetyltransferase